MFGIRRNRDRLQGMAERNRRLEIVCYAIAAGFYPRVYTSKNVKGIDVLPAGLSGAGGVRVWTGNKASLPPPPRLFKSKHYRVWAY